MDNVAEGAYTWDTVVTPYVKNQQILICPSNRFSRDARSYALPRYVSGEAPDLMPNPSATVCLFDKGAHPPGTLGDAAAENFFQTHDYSAGDLDTTRWHNDGKNFVYCDGHAKWHAGGSGPFAACNASSTCPGGYEAHEPGHCEFPGANTGDWPQ
jgi:prepilin-type processing-associated H-X9-DG protein